MITLTYSEMVADLQKADHCVKTVLFSDPHCEVCGVFKHELAHFESDEYRVYVVEDQTGNPFPVQSFPCVYVHIPGTERPLFRLGGVTHEQMQEDVDVQLEALNSGIDYLICREDAIARKRGAA
jgi:hypothetical protein